MKKIFGVLLSVICICCAAIGLTGCKKDKHTHSFDKQVITDEYKATDSTCTEAAKYYYSCSCGEKGAETFEYGDSLGHSFTNYVSDNNATCTEDGTKTAKCDRCDKKNTVKDIDSKLHHSYTEQVVSDEYLAAPATCTEKATYYYSCKCGEKGAETFEYGDSLGHSFTNYVSDNNATCTEDGTKTAKCDRCNETDTIPDENSKLGHEFTDYVSDNNATYKKDGTKTAHCNRNGCTATDTIPDENSKLESKMTFKTLTVGEKNTEGNVSVYGKVPNAQKTYSFIDEIKTEGVVRFVVSTDVYGMHTVVTKTIPLSEGDNKIFVIELNGEDVKSIYEVTIRRRPMYSVVFDTNGGTILDSRQIEEGTVITAPETTKAGYTFIEWDYDFTQPITQNTTIKATWSTNTNTPYKVEYYKENIEDDNYTLCETSDLQGVSDAIASAEQKAYEHFTFDENESVPSGAIAGNGSLILKMYYKRNVYAISNANSAYGEITNAATIKYGSPIKELATEYLGCEFIGWFNGETLLSSAKRYEFTAECDVYAKFKAKDEMSDFNFKSSTTACEITSLKDKNAASVVIPDCVTSIGKKAFYNCDKLTSVTIPDSVTSIGDSAFEMCSGLANIIIPDSVTSIGGGAFYGCNSLKSITLPFVGASRTASDGYNQVFGYIFGYTATSSSSSVSGATYLYYNGEYYRYYIPASLKTVILSESVTSIGDSAFAGCSGLTSVTLPDSVTFIDWGAFWGCSGLTSVTIPNSVTSIGDDAFWGCSGLESITVSSDNTKYHSSENCLIETESKKLILGCNNSVIPTDGSVTSIGDYVFEGCSGLTSVTIPNSVTSIGDYAFYDCSGLTSVTIPDSVTSIGDSAFSGCSGLTSVTIPDSVTSIGDSAFEMCSGLANIIIPDSVTSIGNSAFYGCSGLTSVTIPDSVTSIGNSAFYGCSGLTSVTIPDSVTSIGNSAFEDCVNLRYNEYDNAYYVGNENNPHFALMKAKNTNIDFCSINVNTKIISSNAFENCDNLTNILIPDSITSIGNYAFRDCSGLTSVTLPDSITSIGDSAFYGCSGLTSIIIPLNVTSIGGGAFRGCSKLMNVEVANENNKYHSQNNCIIETATRILIAGCNNSVIPNDGSVTAIGTAAFSGCSFTTITIPDSITFIGNSAFSHCSKITSITIPDSVTSIGDYAFYGCSGLTSVTIPDSVTSIGYSSFEGCSGLTSVTIGNSVTSIGGWAFSGCSGLESITVSSDNTKYHSSENCLIETESKKLILGCNNSVIPTDGSVTSIGDYAFYDCSGLTSVTIPDSVTSIGNGAFEGCSGLTSVTIPDSVTSIGRGAFEMCSGLANIIIPDSVTSIGEWAFYGCRGLTSVTIPDSVTSIGDYAFRGCSRLKNITYTGTIADWKNITKGINWNYEVPTDCVIHCTDGYIKISD